MMSVPLPYPVRRGARLVVYLERRAELRVDVLRKGQPGSPLLDIRRMPGEVPDIVMGLSRPALDCGWHIAKMEALGVATPNEDSGEAMPPATSASMAFGE